MGLIPDDPNVRRAAAYRQPIILRYPDSPASIEIRKIAAQMVGIEYEKVKETHKSEDKFLDKLARSLTKGGD